MVILNEVGYPILFERPVEASHVPKSDLHEEWGGPSPPSFSFGLRAIGTTNSVMDGEPESLEEPDEPAGECPSISAPRACKISPCPV
ncbi:UNVERIFIED_CONTAM: hypothetical protein Slati_3052100 [Sesamum latifolium]|uniref:Uncharacterized protein n=1 Tax=Sesamum latifolium TaxID=2727402 RepID=A0AAW2UU04_9LAMI